MASRNFRPLTLSERLSLANALAMPQPRTGPYRCNFCDRKFDNRYKFSAHFHAHRDIPDDLYIRAGPKSSKRVMRLLKARRLGLEVPPLKKRGRKPKAQARARTPSKTRATFPQAGSSSSATGPRAQGKPDKAIGPMGQAGASSRAIWISGPPGRLPGIRDYARWMVNFKKAAPSPRARGVGPVVATRFEEDEMAALGPPPGFEHVIPDLNCPLPGFSDNGVERDIVVIID